MGTPASVASGATEQHRHVLNDSFSSPQLLAKEPDVSFRVSTAETQHADRQAVPPKPTSHSAKRAHPEGEYFVRRQVPMRAFLERKLESGQINESQRRALKKLRALDDRPTVTFGPASIINIDLPSQVTDDEPYPTPLFPPDQYSKSPMQTSTPNSKVARPPSPAPSFGLQRQSSRSSDAHLTSDTEGTWVSDSAGSVYNWASSDDSDSKPPTLVDTPLTSGSDSEHDDQSMDSPPTRPLAEAVDPGRRPSVAPVCLQTDRMHRTLLQPQVADLLGQRKDIWQQRVI